MKSKSDTRARHAKGDNEETVIDFTNNGRANGINAQELLDRIKKHSSH